MKPLMQACIALIVLAALCERAAGYLVIPQKKKTLQVVMWRKRDDFTPYGWKFRQAAV